MSDKHKDEGWIFTLVKQEFVSACSIFNKAYQSDERIGEDRFARSSDGLSIRMTEEKTVQIIEFHKHKRRVDATIADGQTKIRATFSKGCTKEFAKKEGRQFTDRTIGGLLKISDYSLIFNPREPASKMFMLKVEQFKVLGSEGSAPFGQPSNIDQKPGLRDMIVRLNDLFRRDGNDLRDDLRSPIPLQAGDKENSESSSPTKLATQAGFSTQSRVTTARPELAAIEKIHIAPGKGSNLLAALIGKRQSDVQHPKRMADELPGSSTGLLDKPTRNPSVLKPITEDKMLGITSKLDEKANVKHSQSLLSSIQPHRNSSSREVHVLAKDTGPIFSHSHTLSRDNNEKENSQESVKPQVAAFQPHKESTKKHTLGHERQIIAPFTCLTKDANPFEGMKRVPRSYVRVPEQQQTILNRKDSWVQSETDKQPIYPNIPPEILRDLALSLNQSSSEQSSKTLKGEDITVDSDGEDTYASKDAVDEESEEDSDGEIRGFNQASDFEDYAGEKSRLDDSRVLLPSIATSLEIDKRDQKVKDSKDYDELSEEDEEVPWTPSPQRAPRIGRPGIPEDLSESPHELASHVELNEDAPLNTPSPSVPSSPPLGQSPVTTLTKLSKLQKAGYSDLPSSSQGIEDELEFDVLHAVGDRVDNSEVEMEDTLGMSLEFPSTATHQQFLVQVEQTPFHNQRIKEPANTRGSPSSQPFSQTDGEKGSQEISSDPVIPATFNDASRERLLATQEKIMTASEIMPGIASAERESNNYLELEQTIDDESGIEKGNDLAQRQLSEELKSSQLDDRKDEHRSTDEFSLSAQNFRTSKFVQQSMDDSSKSGNESPPDPTPLAGFQTHISEKTLQKMRGSVVHHDQMSPVKRRRLLIKPPVFPQSQDEDVTRDIGEMARDNRHLFGRETAAADFKEHPLLRKLLRSRSAEPEGLSDEYVVLETPNTFESPRNETEIEADLPRISEYLSAELESGLASKSSISFLNDTAIIVDDEDPIVSLSKFGSQTTAFNIFQCAYPSYRGSRKEFTNAVCYIEWNKAEKNELPCEDLWDDLIGTLAAEYKDYIRERRLSLRDKINDGDGILTCLQFFSGRVKAHSYRDRIITPMNLHEAILSLDPEEVDEAQRRLEKYDRTTSNISSSTYTSENARFAQQETCPESSSDGFQSRIPPSKMRLPLKRPFFETLSQVQTTKQQKPSSPSLELSSKTSQTPRNARHLPWHTPTTSKNYSPISQVCPTSEAPVRQVGVSPFSPFVRSRSNQQEGMETNYESSELQGSPILGTAEKGARTMSDFRARTSSQERSTLKDSYLAATKNDRRRTTSMLSTRINNLGKVEGWLADQNIASAGLKKMPFDEFVRYKFVSRRRSGLMSNTSTPKLSDGRRKTKPDTQG